MTPRTRRTATHRSRTQRTAAPRVVHLTLFATAFLIALVPRAGRAEGAPAAEPALGGGATAGAVPAPDGKIAPSGQTAPGGEHAPAGETAPGATSPSGPAVAAAATAQATAGRGTAAAAGGGVAMAASGAVGADPGGSEGGGEQGLDGGGKHRPAPTQETMPVSGSRESMTTPVSGSRESMTTPVSGSRESTTTPASGSLESMTTPAVAATEPAAPAEGGAGVGGPGAGGRLPVAAAEAGGGGAAAPQGAAEGAASAAPSAGMPAELDGEALARAFRLTGAAPTVESDGRGTAVLVPFGHGRPVLRCAPLRACAVELEPGELVLATSLGDAARWLVQAAASGPGARTPLLVVKPTACDLSTNLVVATDRRIYEVALDSPPCRNADAGEGGAYNPRLPYTGLIRFYYPDELVRRWAEQERAARQQAAERAAGRTPLAPSARLARLNFDYAWDRARRWPWVPTQVFDDGEHTYVVLPPAAHLAELPILLGVEPGGGLALLTYRVEGDTLIADRVLERAALVVGHGRRRDEQRLEISNRSFARRGGR
jgi:P-type conjugative transfer protein TrbG